MARPHERNSLVKNRMREICTSGSVRGGDGDIPTYSAAGPSAYFKYLDTWRKSQAFEGLAFA